MPDAIIASSLSSRLIIVHVWTRIAPQHRLRAADAEAPAVATADAAAAVGAQPLRGAAAASRHAAAAAT
jgi:hypothetical protein